MTLEHFSFFCPIPFDYYRDYFPCFAAFVFSFLSFLPSYFYLFISFISFISFFFTWRVLIGRFHYQRQEKWIHSSLKALSVRLSVCLSVCLLCVCVSVCVCVCRKVGSIFLLRPFPVVPGD